jgi:hypothetical protein
MWFQREEFGDSFWGVLEGGRMIKVGQRDPHIFDGHCRASDEQV